MATTTKSTQSSTTAGSLVVNGAKLVGDVGILPGTSHFIDGDVKSGVLYAAGGLIARAFIGPVAFLVFGVDSLSKSITGKHIHQHFFEVEPAKD
jgi:hypothetical protein